MYYVGKSPIFDKWHRDSHTQPTLANSSDEPGKHFSLVRPLPKTEATWFCGLWNISSQTTFITSTNDLSITRQTLAEIKPSSSLNFSKNLSLDTSGLMKLAKNQLRGLYKSPTNLTDGQSPCALPIYGGLANDHTVLFPASCSNYRSHYAFLASSSSRWLPINEWWTNTTLRAVYLNTTYKSSFYISTLSHHLTSSINFLADVQHHAFFHFQNFWENLSTLVFWNNFNFQILRTPLKVSRVFFLPFLGSIRLPFIKKIF